MHILIIGKGLMGSSIFKLLKDYNLRVGILGARELVADFDQYINAIARQDLIIECIQEDLAFKRELLFRLSKINEEGLLVSNTSSLSISALQEDLINPGRFAGLHFMNPPKLIVNVELVKGAVTQEKTLDSLRIWLESLNRKVSEVIDTPGFILNALLFSLLNRAAYMFEDLEVEPIVLDRMMIDVCGHRLGPLKTLDLIGIDTSLKILHNLYIQKPEVNLRPARILETLVNKGMLGIKSGEGFYRY